MIKKQLNSILQFLICAGVINLLSNTTLLFAETNDLSKIENEITEIQEILFKPEKSQLAVLVSVNTNSDFILDTVSFFIDSKKTKTYLYTERESKALLNSAQQKIYVGDILKGAHTIKAQITAFGINEQSYKISSSSKFTKTNTTKFIELKISKTEQQDLPVLNIKIWE